MNIFLSAIHIVVSVLLIILIVIQSEGLGLSSTFGGPSSYHSKRGMEKILFSLTVGLAIVFLITSVVNFLTA